MFKTLILRYFTTNNIQRLIDLLNTIEAQLEAYMISQRKKADGLQQKIVDLEFEKQKVEAAVATAANLRAGVRNVTTV